jgi:hypothetical protein
LTDPSAFWIQWPLALNKGWYCGTIPVSKQEALRCFCYLYMEFIFHLILMGFFLMNSLGKYFFWNHVTVTVFDIKEAQNGEMKLFWTLKQQIPISGLTLGLEPMTYHTQTLSHCIVVYSTHPHKRDSNSQLTTLVVIGTDCTGICISNYIYLPYDHDGPSTCQCPPVVAAVIEAVSMI